MKTKYLFALIPALLIGMTGCDKDFGDINKDPLSPTSLDASYLLASTQDMAESQHHYEAGLVQQLNLIITGQEDAGSHNIEKADFVGQRWDGAYGNLKTLVDIIVTLEDDPLRTNIYNMARILKVWNYMVLVDTYGDVPFTEAIMGYYVGDFFPIYDKQQDIYLAIEDELVEAIDALDPAADKVTNDMFYKGDIAKWKKLGNSILLRLGMRYSKVNASKAETIVQLATDPARGGVMETNADNVIIPYNATQNNPTSNFMNGSVRQNYHVGRPFVDWMKNNNDPRMKYLICLYDNPNIPTGGNKNSNPADQIGAPYGYDPATIKDEPLFPGEISSSIWAYSFPDRQTTGKVDAWCNLITAAQTQLLMAEARYREWITTGTAKEYYENAITRHMTMKDFYSLTRGGDSPITPDEITAYLAEPGIAFSETDALKQINEQYWMACYITNFHEGWCNLRRSGYPELAPVNYPGQDPDVTAGDGFIHRLIYPPNETNFNKANVQDAAVSIGGDKLSTRIFWDTELP